MEHRTIELRQNELAGADHVGSAEHHHVTHFNTETALSQSICLSGSTHIPASVHAIVRKRVSSERAKGSEQGSSSFPLDGAAGFSYLGTVKALGIGTRGDAYGGWDGIIVREPCILRGQVKSRPHPFSRLYATGCHHLPACRKQPFLRCCGRSSWMRATYPVSSAGPFLLSFWRCSLWVSGCTLDW